MVFHIATKLSRKGLMSDIEEVRMFRKFKKEDERVLNRLGKETKSEEELYNTIKAKIEDQHVISREEFKIYEKYEKYETYTKDFYTFKCPKCADSYDVIIRGNTANEKTVQIVYVEDEKVEKK